jgi:hypothetical protein
VRERTFYVPRVSYEYAVGKSHHLSDRISHLDASSTNRGWAEEIVARYPAGASVSVRVNPAKADESVLEPGAASGGRAALIMAALFLAVGGIFLYLMLSGTCSSLFGLD